MNKILFSKLISLYRKSINRQLIEQDIDHWQEVFHWNLSYPNAIKRLFIEKPEFRNLFYYRIGGVRYWSRVIQWFFPPLPTLYIWCQDIGGGAVYTTWFRNSNRSQENGRTLSCKSTGNNRI